jgi:hypothetical protein
LQRSLQQAGLKTSSDSLQFSLRDQTYGGQGQGQGHNNGQQNVARVVVPDRDLTPLDVIPNGYGRMLGGSSGVDIRV